MPFILLGCVPFTLGHITGFCVMLLDILHSFLALCHSGYWTSRNATTESNECNRKKINIDMLLSIKEEVENLNKLKYTVADIHKNIKDLLSVNEKMTIPVGLHRSLGDTFTCKIWKFDKSPIDL